MQTQLLRYGTDEWRRVDEDDQEKILAAFQRLEAMGYNEASAKEALVYVLRHREEE